MSFAEFPLPLNAALFAVAAVVVWRAGQRLASAVDGLAETTRLGHAFLGALLLGGVTSLPEAATVVTASAIDNPVLSVGNVFGSTSTNLVILAVADLAFRGPLIAAADRRSVMRQGVAVIVLLLIAAVAIVFDDPFDAPIGVWPVVIVAGVVVAFVVARRGSAPDTDPRRREDVKAEVGSKFSGEADLAREAKRAREANGDSARKGAHQRADRDEGTDPGDGGRHPARRFIVAIVVIGLVVVVAGYVGAATADALSRQLGLTSAFVGFVLLAGTTSLPEIGTTIGAVRIREPSLAIGNVLGTNIFNMALLLAADIGYRKGPVLDAVGTNAVLALAIAIALVSTYIAAARWPHVTVGQRLGAGSVLVIVIYGAGALALSTLA